MNYKAQRGTYDILPKDEVMWNKVQKSCFETAKLYGYQFIETPLFEDSKLFERTVGESTDIVEKEMYSFTDKGGDSISLRPENTAGVCRAFIENGLHNNTLPARLFYYGPMFRYERPQSGRYRQFHQFGVECIGDSTFETDYEVIDIAWKILKNLDIKGIKLNINSLGDKEDREIYIGKLKDYFKNYINDLPKVDKLRFERSPLRLLDSKEEITIKISEDAPKTLDYISIESKEHHENLIQKLEKLNSMDSSFNYEVNHKLVRGLDYYNRTVFEYTSNSLGPQGVILGGGRYDPLIKILGGPETPAVGFAMGIERVVNELNKNEVENNSHIDAVLIIVDEDLRMISQEIANDFRENKIKTIIAPKKSIKAQMRFANNINSKSAIFIGKNEIENNKISVKFLQSSREQIEIDRNNIVEIKAVLNN